MTAEFVILSKKNEKPKIQILVNFLRKFDEFFAI